MNHPLVRWLLDLDMIPADAEGLRVAWEHPWAAWVWALILLAAGLLAAWGYRRLSGHRPTRIALAVVRFLVITLALLLIAGPLLELPRESVEPDWVLVLVDRSESMTIGDAPDMVGRATRDDQLSKVLTDHDVMWRALAERRQVRWLGFHSGVFNLQSNASSEVELGVADGRRTNLNAAIEQAMQRAAARPVSGVVVLSDGRTGDPPSRALMRRLQAEAVPIFTIPLGSADPVGDLALRRIDSPRRAFVRDKVPVVVELDRFGVAPNQRGTVTLIDEETGETLDKIELTPDAPQDRLTLTAEPSLAGDANWAIVLETEEPDLIPENNRKSFSIELVDRPLRVLYIDGYPRWEYRYVKNLLIREESIESSVMLLSADRDFAQEGNQPITRLPRSPEELARYDVIVLGDVPATFFSPDQLEMIRQHVAERGAGLLWIGGHRHSPKSYTGTVLADLLPMRGGLDLATLGVPVNMAPTPLAERLGVLRLVTSEGVGWPDELADPNAGWSRLHSAQRIDPGRLKPTAEVLAHTVQEIDGAHFPLLVHLRYGAGQTIFAATDEVWRWRYGRGELLPEQFWIQMVRMLGRESLSTSGERAVLNVAPRRVQVGQPVQIDLHMLDSKLVDSAPGSVAVVVETPDGEKIADVELRRMPDAETRFAATLLPDRTGAMRVVVRDRSLPDLDLVATLEVFAPDDELRRPETDHDLLRQLAEATDGRVLASDEIQLLPELLPNREVRTKNPLRERLWDTPLAFGLVLLLLTCEWVGRKILRLV